MMVETTHAFVKLKQIKAAVSAGGIKFPENQKLFLRLENHFGQTKKLTKKSSIRWQETSGTPSDESDLEECAAL